MVDANSAYTLADADLFGEMDRYSLTMNRAAPRVGRLWTTRRCSGGSVPGLPRRVAYTPSRTLARAPRLGAWRVIKHQGGPRGGFGEPSPSTTSPGPRRFRSGAAGCLESGIGALANVHLQTPAGSRFPATPRPARATSRRTRRARSCSPSGTIDVPEGRHRPRDSCGRGGREATVARSGSLGWNSSRIASDSSASSVEIEARLWWGWSRPARDWPSPRTRSTPAPARSRRPVLAAHRGLRLDDVLLADHARRRRRASSATLASVHHRRVAGPHLDLGAAAQRLRDADAMRVTRSGIDRRSASSKVRMVPRSVTSSGMTLKAWPPWTEPSVTTAASVGGHLAGDDRLQRGDHVGGGHHRVRGPVRLAAVTSAAAHHDAQASTAAMSGPAFTPSVPTAARSRGGRPPPPRPRPSRPRPPWPERLLLPPPRAGTARAR